MDWDPRHRFSAVAEDYRRWRPSYPNAAIDWILATTGVRPPAVVVDLGCGTGISTRLFASRGFHVIGIDPNESMLRLAQEEGGAEYHVGTAEATGLPSGTADLVTTAQALHWFDMPAALGEFRRLLRPKHWCSAFENRRALTPFNEEYSRILESFREDPVETRGHTRPFINLEESTLVTDLIHAEFFNSQRFTEEGLLGRAHSASYAVLEGEKARSLDEALLRLFRDHVHEGTVEMQYRTVVYCWRLL